MRGGRFRRSLAAALAALVMLTAVQMDPVVGQELPPPTVMSPGPLDQSYGTWGALWSSWWSASRTRRGCSEGHVGGVNFVPPGIPDQVLRCRVPADTPLLFGITGRPCVTYDRAERRAREANMPDERRRLQRALGAGLTRVFGCLSRTLEQLDDPYLTVDGFQLPVDDAFLTTGQITVPSGRRWVVGFFAMLEPLPVGSHTVEWGVDPPAGSTTSPESMQRTAVLEVVEPSLPPDGRCCAVIPSPTPAG